MQLSLTQRVIFGFTLVSIFLLAIAGTGLWSQLRMSAQLTLTASTLTELLDQSNTLLLHAQNANRAMMQHANTQSLEERQRLEAEFSAARTRFNQLANQLKQSSAPFPSLAKPLNAALAEAQPLFEQAERHLGIHNARIEARQRSFAELSEFDGEFIFFAQDFTDFIDDANFEGQQQVGWDLEFIVNQVSGTQLYLQRALAVTDAEGIARLKSELTTSLEQILAKAANVEKQMPGLAEDANFYINLLNRAIAEPEGLFQQHLTYVDLNLESEQLLAAIAQSMDAIATQLVSMVSQVRDISADARQNAQDSLSQSLLINVTLAVISIVVAVVVATTVVQAIRKPLKIVMRMLQQVAAGDLRDRIRTRFRSEMGLVAKNVNELSDRLSELIFRIQQSAQTIRVVAGESQAMSEKTNRSVAEQRAQTELLATAVTEMEAAIQQVASHAADTSQEVSTVADEAKTNMTATTRNLEFIQELKSSLNEASDVMNQLSSESDQIGEILTVIQGIAEQTNLLALNAAIEAARAGEQGRGFAVVADEVRSLASRTQQSANEIQEMIERLQDKSGRAAKIVSNNLNQADQTVTQTEQSHQSLKTMMERLNHVNDMSRSIATAADEQSSVAKEVAQNIVQISDMTDHIAQDAEANAKNSESLNDLSSQQSALVQQFQLAEDPEKDTD